MTLVTFATAGHFYRLQQFLQPSKDSFTRQGLIYEKSVEHW
jgi:hypothetical protein